MEFKKYEPSPVVNWVIGFMADFLREGIIEGKKPKIVWEEAPIDAHWEQSDPPASSDRAKSDFKSRSKQS